MPEQALENCLPAQAADLEGLDVELPIKANTEITPTQYSTSFAAAADSAANVGNDAAARVYQSFSTVCSAIASFDTPGEPYRPFWTDHGTGKRSLVPMDFGPGDVIFLRAAFPNIEDPWLKARVVDSLFLRDKTTRDLWPLGVSAFLNAGKGCFRTEGKEALNCFQRALYLGRLMGRESAPRKEAEKEVFQFADENLDAAEPWLGADLLKLLQENEVGEPTIMAPRAETLAESYASQPTFFAARGALGIAEKWWRRLHEEHKAAEAKLKSARMFIREALYHQKSGGTLGAAEDSFMRGILALQQSRAPSEEIEAAQKQLRECQRTQEAKLHEELWSNQPILPDPFVQAMEARANSARQWVSDLSWLKALSRLAGGIDLAKPADVEKGVREHAQIGIMDFLITKVYPGEYGRTAHTQPSPFLKRGEEFQNLMFEKRFEHARKWIWDMRADDFINPCRQQIWEDHRPAVHDWAMVVSGNPVIPPQHAYGVMRGLHAGLSGEWIIAAHLLAPKFESILRYILEKKGIETSFIREDLTQPNKTAGLVIELAEEKNALSDNWIFELRGILLQKTGYDLRNRIAHGFATDAECYETAGTINAWWLILRMCFSAREFFSGY